MIIRGYLSDSVMKVWWGLKVLTFFFSWRDPPPEKKIRLIDAKNPILAPILVTRELHTPESDRSCLHVEIDTLKYLNYQPGMSSFLFHKNELIL